MYMANKCISYSEITVESGTQLKSVHFTFNYHIQSNVEVTVKKLYISFTIIPLYLEQQLHVNRTVRLQWKLGHI